MILSRTTYLHKYKTKTTQKTYYLSNLVRSIQLYTHIFPLYRIRDRYSCSRSRCRVPLNPAQIKIEIKRTTFFKEVFCLIHIGYLHQFSMVVGDYINIMKTTFDFNFDLYQAFKTHGSRPTGVHLNIRAGPTFAALHWTVP